MQISIKGLRHDTNGEELFSMYPVNHITNITFDTFEELGEFIKMVKLNDGNKVKVAIPQPQFNKIVINKLEDL